MKMSMHEPRAIVAALALTALIAIDDADAKRLGGGRSLGAQRPSVTPRASAPPPRRRRRAARSRSCRRTPGATLPAKPAAAAGAARPSARRAGSARSPASPPASGSPRCCRISGCPKASARSCCSRSLAIGVRVRVRMLFARRGRRSGRSRTPAARGIGAARRFDKPRRRNGAARRGSSRCSARAARAALAKPLPAGIRRRGLRPATRSSSSSGCRRRTTPATARRSRDVHDARDVRRDHARSRRARPRAAPPKSSTSTPRCSR